MAPNAGPKLTIEKYTHMSAAQLFMQATSPRPQRLNCNSICKQTVDHPKAELFFCSRQHSPEMVTKETELRMARWHIFGAAVYAHGKQLSAIANGGAIAAESAAFQSGSYAVLQHAAIADDVQHHGATATATATATAQSAAKWPPATS